MARLPRAPLNIQNKSRSGACYLAPSKNPWAGRLGLLVDNWNADTDKFLAAGSICIEMGRPIILISGPNSRRCFVPPDAHDRVPFVQHQFDGGNVTLSKIALALRPKDDGAKILCRAENVHLGPASAIEDTWLLDVYCECAVS